MKVLIKAIREPDPDPLGRWPAMELDLLVEQPKTKKAAEAQVQQAKEWMSPSQLPGKPTCPPVVLELRRPDPLVDVPDFEWPTCQGCRMHVELRNDGDSGDGMQFKVSCPGCGEDTYGATPLETLRKFNRGEFADGES